VRIKLIAGTAALALTLMTGCSSDSTNSTASSNSVNADMTNTNATTSVATSSPTTMSPDFDTTTATDNGVTTETRTYHNNPRISKVVITTNNGKRTATVYNASGEHKDIQSNDLDTVLNKSGDEIANAAGFVADKAEDVGGKTKDVGEKVVDKSKDVGGKVVEGGKTVGEKTVEGGKTVVEKTGEGAKAIGNKAVEGAKKTGSAIKKAVTP
jgi:hypothetical protein